MIDDPDADGRIAEAGSGERLNEVLDQTIAADRDDGEGIHVYASRCLSNPIVEDVGEVDQGRANDVGMDINAAVAKDVFGPPAHPGAQVAVVGASGCRTKLSVSS